MAVVIGVIPHIDLSPDACPGRYTLINGTIYSACRPGCRENCIYDNYQ
jgi:hypothetical protein